MQPNGVPAQPKMVAQVVVTLAERPDGGRFVHVSGKLPSSRQDFLMMIEEAKEHLLQQLYRPAAGKPSQIEVAPATFLKE